MQSRRVAAVLAVAALIAAVVVFIVLQGDSGSGGSPSDRAFKFQFANGKAVGGSHDVTANQGDHLTVTLHTDVPAELHVHGYELAKDVGAGGTGSISFTADATGEFEIEAHHLVHGEEQTGVELAQLQVNP
jgi:hypothetical protein